MFVHCSSLLPLFAPEAVIRVIVVNPHHDLVVAYHGLVSDAYNIPARSHLDFAVLEIDRNDIYVQHQPEWLFDETAIMIDDEYIPSFVLRPSRSGMILDAWGAKKCYHVHALRAVGIKHGLVEVVSDAK